ncbi:MAG: preprotein translocase subunit SecG [Acidobacteriota bacterium]
MTILLYTIYVLVCLFLIAVVLLQSGKGADLASAFGAGGSQAAIGARSAATALSRLTTYSAVLFMVLSLVLAVRKSKDESVLDRSSAGKPAAAGTLPIAPAPSTAPSTGAIPAPAMTPATEAPGTAAPPAALPSSDAPAPGTEMPESPVPPAPETTSAPAPATASEAPRPGGGCSELCSRAADPDTDAVTRV